MSHQQFHAEVQQWAELEEAGQDEAEQRERMDRLDEQDEREFVNSLEEKYPILKSWSTK